MVMNHHKCSSTTSMERLNLHHLLGQPQEQYTTSRDTNILRPVQDIKMEVVLDKKLDFPLKIVVIILWPDIVLWSIKQKQTTKPLLLNGVEEAYERKKTRYS
ncbi:hypothetical protein CHARACLAT_027912 [Characodon lateralis]|uniref:Uncharacterized protein n=1 Tax=Characodon lateralis TaxID=208331 RepID=A0ABU7EDE7_9TELE|nr:hypothetical protein [Characodon lateralis]